MPVFDFESKDGEIISVLVPHTAPAKERHIQRQNGKVYKRVYSAPNAAVNSLVGDSSRKDFKRVTEGKKLTHGDLWEMSKDASKRREEREGVDPVKQQFYRKYEKEFGTKHADEIKAEKLAAAQKVASKLGMKIELD